MRVDQGSEGSLDTLAALFTTIALSHQHHFAHMGWGGGDAGRGVMSVSDAGNVGTIVLDQESGYDHDTFKNKYRHIHVS